MARIFLSDPSLLVRFGFDEFVIRKVLLSELSSYSGVGEGLVVKRRALDGHARPISCVSIATVPSSTVVLSAGFL